MVGSECGIGSLEAFEELIAARAAREGTEILSGRSSTSIRSSTSESELLSSEDTFFSGSSSLSDVSDVPDDPELSRRTLLRGTESSSAFRFAIQRVGHDFCRQYPTNVLT